MKETNIHLSTITHKTWNQAQQKFDHSFDFAYRTKADYLEFRRCWKENYAIISGSIRSLKGLIRATMRKREYAGKHPGELNTLKSEATLQLAMLKSAKQEANRQYLVKSHMTT